jgi:ABC-2 type transport system permease protein
MKTFFTLLGREVKSYFYSPIAYVVLFYFLLLIGHAFYYGVSILNRGPTEITVVEAFFNTVFFWFPFVLIFPLITMRTYSEEFRMGTFEPLTTAPVTDWQVVLAKYFGAVTFYIILWAPTFSYFAIFQLVTRHLAAYANGAYFGSYLLLLLVGMFYISIGCVASALTSDQINAAVISFSAITVCFFAGLLSFVMMVTDPTLKNLNSYISTVEHMADFSRGLIDSRPIVWYLSMTVLMLMINFQVFQYRKWKS